jgi:hypothetical protein
VFTCYLLLAYAEGSNVNGVIGPLICVGFLSYFIACMFTEIFGMCISTLMCCYIADEEMFPPQDRFADGDLRNSLQKAQQSGVATKVIQVRTLKISI